MNGETGAGPERLRGLSPSDARAAALVITVSAAGGLASERVVLNARVTGDGHLEGRLQDELRGRTGAFDARMNPAELGEILDLVGSDDFVGQPLEPPMFVPDTVVASVELTLDGTPIATYLVALDDEQLAPTDVVAAPTRQLLLKIRNAAENLVG